MARFAQATDEPTTVYLVGGATAVWEGIRDSTIDIDLKIEPDRGDLLRALPQIKEDLEVNVELASPDLFIPVSAGWQERSPIVDTYGQVTYRHFDLVAQALAKIERGHDRDLGDVTQLLARGLVAPEELEEELERIEPDLYRFPAVDPESLRRAVEAVLTQHRR